MNVIARTEANLRTIHGYCDLSRWDKSLLRSFAIAWPLFEERCLGRNAGASRIKDFSNQPIVANAITVEAEEAFHYFHNRHFVDAHGKDRFFALCHGRMGDHQGPGRGVEDRLRALFGDRAPSDAERIEAVLLVIYRLRNNLLHGNKYDNIVNQRDNFRHSLRVLNSILEI